MFGVNPLIVRKYPGRKNIKYENVVCSFYPQFFSVLNTNIEEY